MDAAPTNLTDKQFWETEYYWGSLGLPARPDRRQPFDRSLADALGRHARLRPGQTVLEVGCAPAKWLVFYAERFRAAVTGVEYSTKGAELSRANLAACGVAGTIVESDFFELSPEPFDVVLSFGFLEHFDDVAAVFRRHVDFVRPGGLLALGVPNFRGLNRIVQRFADPGYLALHNTDAMSKQLFRRFAAENGLLPERLSYLGGFDPSLLRLDRHHPRWHPRRLAPGLLAAAGHQWRRTPLADRLDHRWLSIYLLGVWRRPAT